jgi:hypothetical protein
MAALNRRDTIEERRRGASDGTRCEGCVCSVCSVCSVRGTGRLCGRTLVGLSGIRAENSTCAHAEVRVQC